MKSMAAHVASFRHAALQPSSVRREKDCVWRPPRPLYLHDVEATIVQVAIPARTQKDQPTDARN